MTVGEILDMSLKILKLTCLNLFLHHTHTHTLLVFKAHTPKGILFFSVKGHPNVSIAQWPFYSILNGNL